MALRATVYRITLHVSDLERGHYASYPLRLARHPSETDERLLMRVVAFARHASEALRFGEGLANAEEPDLFERDLTGAINLWIEVGLPEPRWIGKALSQSTRVSILAYGGNVARWGKALREQYPQQRYPADRLDVLEVRPDDSLSFVALAARNATLSATLDDDRLVLAGEAGASEIRLIPL